MTRALYPGTFDPMHNGHVDIVFRASTLFNEVVVAIYDAPPKKLLFETEERLELARIALAGLDNVTVTTYVGLTVECAREVNAQVIVRGLRNVADFEFEHQIGWANSQMAPDVELCCLFCANDYAYLSATILKEVASLDGDYEKWALPHVRAALRRKFAKSDGPEPAQDVNRSDGKLSHHA